MRRQAGVVVGLLDQVLGANMLWAAGEINRPDSGRRTGPSDGHRQGVEIYVAAGDGRNLCDGETHRLQPVLSGGIRATTGSQPFVREAAANTGFLGQNVCRLCTSGGLATLFRGMVGRDPLAKTLKLRPGRKVTFAQTLGFSKK